MDTMTQKARAELQREKDISIAITLDRIHPIDPAVYFKTRDILTIDQAKFKKTANETYFQVGLTLSPSKESGKWNLCRWASNGCSKSCLITTYRLAHGPAVNARILRTRFLMEDRATFLEFLGHELDLVRRRVHSEGRILVVRFNAMSDVRADKVFEPIWHPLDGYVDYTKSPEQYARFLEGELPTNYHLTFSRSELNEQLCTEFIATGGTATLVVRNEATRARLMADGYKGFPVCDGDISDRRWEDPRGHWVALVAKGKAKQDTTGFVVG